MKKQKYPYQIRRGRLVYALPVLLLLLGGPQLKASCFYSDSSQAPGDRNKRCRCEKYQREAEKEYKLILAKTKKEPVGGTFLTRVKKNHVRFARPLFKKNKKKAGFFLKSKAHSTGRLDRCFN